MQLPEPIFSAVSRAFDAQHALWHLVRFRRDALPESLRPDWDRGRALFPGVKFVDEAGSGAEFLVFHREMVRIFKGVLDANPGSGARYEPWSEIPAAVADLLQRAGFDPAAAVAEIDRLTQSGTLDALGAFIEATDLAPNIAGANVHNTTHGAISFMENSEGEEFDMGNPRTAPRNALFWHLHGWIDEIFARWQRNHGEAVDQSPLPPGHHHAPMHRMIAAAPGPELARPATDRGLAALFRRRFALERFEGLRRSRPAAKPARPKAKPGRAKPAATKPRRPKAKPRKEPAPRTKRKARPAKRKGRTRRGR